MWYIDFEILGGKSLQSQNAENHITFCHVYFKYTVFPKVC